MEITQFRYKNDNCCKMLCQVQTPYLEIFDFSVFPIFIIRRSKKSPAVYYLPFQVANIYLFRWSRWLLLPGVVELFIFFPTEISSGVLTELCYCSLRLVLFCKTNLVEISTSMMTLPMKGLCPFNSDKQ